MKVSTAAKLREVAARFAAAGIDTPRLDAEVLLASVLNVERLALYVDAARTLTDGEISRFESLAARRLEKIPVAYLVGGKEFMGMNFDVSPEVLIPRPDTEILAQGTIDRLSKIPGGLTLLDLGTGSGAICISILKNVANLTAWAVDVSPGAVAVAKGNAEKLGVSDRAKFLVGDLFAPVEGKIFDAIVSNPPYIPTGDLPGLQAEVRREPPGALDGGAEGLDFYERILRDAPRFLKPGGMLAVEVGINQAGRVKEIFERGGNFGEVEVWKDLAGIDRVIFARSL